MPAADAKHRQGGQFETGKYAEIAAQARQRASYQTDIGVRVLQSSEMRHTIFNRGQRIDCQSEAGAPWNVIDQKGPFRAGGQLGEVGDPPAAAVPNRTA